MARYLPPLNALRAFEAAGRHGSFTAAADELNVSHSSISRHVRSLERRIGVQLFKNQPRGVVLTEVGFTYLKQVTSALDMISSATDDIRDQSDDRLVISCEPTFTLKWLMPVLGKFQDAHPEIELKINDTFEVADVLQNACDIAIRFSSHPIEDLETDLIGQSPVFPVGSPKLMGGEKRFFEPQELLQFRLLVENHPELWKRWFAQVGLPETRLPKKSGELKTMLAIEAAIAGHGLALVSTELVANDIAAGRLVRFSDVGLDYGAYKLVYQQTTGRRRSFQAFRNWLLEESKTLR